MEIAKGSTRHYGVELRLTTMELDMIVEGLRLVNKDKFRIGDLDQLLKDFETMSNLVRIKSLRKYGNFDDSRLNFS